MADSDAPPRGRWTQNRLLPAICFSLIALFVIGALALGGGEESSAASEPTARALVVAPAESPVTVLVPACRTRASSDADAPGTTRVALPPGRGVRTVLVPHCTTGTGSLPSAAFVVANDTELPASARGPGGITAQSRLTLPAGSEADTIVVPPCRGNTEVREDVVLRPEGDVLTAPSC